MKKSQSNHLGNPGPISDRFRTLIKVKIFLKSIFKSGEPLRQERKESIKRMRSMQAVFLSTYLLKSLSLLFPSPLCFVSRSLPSSFFFYQTKTCKPFHSVQTFLWFIVLNIFWKTTKVFCSDLCYSRVMVLL